METVRNFVRNLSPWLSVSSQRVDHCKRDESNSESCRAVSDMQDLTAVNQQQNGDVGVVKTMQHAGQNDPKSLQIHDDIWYDTQDSVRHKLTFSTSQPSQDSAVFSHGKSTFPESQLAGVQHVPQDHTTFSDKIQVPEACRPRIFTQIDSTQTRDHGACPQTTVSEINPVFLRGNVAESASVNSIHAADQCNVQNHALSQKIQVSEASRPRIFTGIDSTETRHHSAYPDTTVSENDPVVWRGNVAESANVNSFHVADQCNVPVHAPNTHLHDQTVSQSYGDQNGRFTGNTFANHASHVHAMNASQYNPRNQCNIANNPSQSGNVAQPMFSSFMKTQNGVPPPGPVFSQSEARGFTTDLDTCLNSKTQGSNRDQRDPNDQSRNLNTSDYFNHISSPNSTSYTPVSMDLTLQSPDQHDHSVQSQSVQSNKTHTHFSRPNRRERLPEHFNGLEIKWSDYLAQFNIIASWNGWSNSDKAMNLIMSLRGQAREMVGGLPPHVVQDFHLLTDAIGRRFDPAERAVSHRCEFQNRKRKPSESASDFAYDLRKIAVRAFSEHSNTDREDRCLDQFMIGLGDLDMRKHIQFKHPQNFDEAISHAIEYEAVVGKVGQHKPKVEGVHHVQNFDSQLEKTVASMVNQNKQMMQQILDVTKQQSEAFTKMMQTASTSGQNRHFHSDSNRFHSDSNRSQSGSNRSHRQNQQAHNRQNRRTATADTECYKCHQKGHFMADCPSRNQNQSN